MSLKYWDRRALHDRHAKALDAASARYRDKVRDNLWRISNQVVQAYKEGRR